MTEYFKIKIISFFPFLLPFLVVFSRFTADLTVIVISIFFLIYSVKNYSWEWIKSKWIIFAFLFWIYCLVIVSPLSDYPEKSFMYSLFFIRWPIFAAAIYFWILKDETQRKKFLLSILVITSFLSFDTWWQYFFRIDIFGFEVNPHNNRLTGPFDRPIVGMWLSKISLLLPFLYLAYQNKSEKNLLLFYFIGLFLLITIFITGERMALLLILSSLSCLTLGLFFEKLISTLTIFIFILLLFFIILIFYNYDSTIYNRAIVSTIDKIINWKTSDYGLVWESAYMVWIKSPIIGSGMHTYRDACNDLIIYGTHNNPIGGGVCFHPHNISLELLSETGIIGFFLFFLMIIFIFLELGNSLQQKKWFLMSINISIFIGCFFPLSAGMSIFSNKLASIIWLIIGFCLAFNRYRSKF